MRRGRRCRERARIELRGEPGKQSVVIDGYVNVTGRDSRPIPDRKGGYFIERIQKGAFGKAIARAQTVKALLDHKWDHAIGETGNNLTLKEDVIGLRAHLETSDPEVVRLAKEKRLRGWSFDIKRPVENRAETPGGLPIRTITDFDISEVSLVSDRLRPWYESTTVETRAGEGEEEIAELRAEEFDPDYIGFEKEKEKPDNSKLKKIIERYGGNV